jgi:hypothetical protein
MNASFCLAIFHRVGRPRVRATTGDRRRPTLARAYPRLTATTVALATQLDVPEASLSDRTLAHAGVGASAWILTSSAGVGRDGSTLFRRNRFSERIIRSSAASAFENFEEGAAEQFSRRKAREGFCLIHRDRAATEGPQEKVQKTLCHRCVIKDLSDSGGLGRFFDEVAHAH